MSVTDQRPEVVRVRTLLNAALDAAYKELKRRNANRVVLPPKDLIRIEFCDTQQKFEEKSRAESSYRETKEALWDIISHGPTFARIYELVKEITPPIKVRIQIAQREFCLTDKDYLFLRSLRIRA